MRGLGVCLWAESCREEGEGVTSIQDWRASVSRDMFAILKRITAVGV